MSLEVLIKTSVVLTRKKKYTHVALWSAQYNSSKKNWLISYEHLVAVVQPEKVLLIYTLFHNKIHNFLGSVTWLYFNLFLV